MMRSQINQCVVCMDEFENGVGVNGMPCRHVYNHDCLIPWLQMHNSCPVCRHELPTGDAEYESRARGGDQGGGSGERRISLLFRRHGAGSDSDSGSGSDMDIRGDELD
ncbi:unnamed protein product [Eruca vesicaria subsp. sativa]|uniref:RING-type E3 ubiquitin transferase n=1 Tax=Eruca vesicaria subsp. sativa TaxID=29727 RepID=A0ABC8M3L4_ERUVS|nr:unnamed protein product [Eruca vesicaria subsp. sativa]